MLFSLKLHFIKQCLEMPYMQSKRNKMFHCFWTAFREKKKLQELKFKNLSNLALLGRILMGYSVCKHLYAIFDYL